MHSTECIRASVLVVDDAPESLAFVCDALDDAGFTILVATDGASALKRLRCVQPDAILLDAGMPGMDGFEVCRRIKADGALSSVPVIFMTGLSETDHVVEGFRAGGVDYVTKPAHPDELIARLRTHTRNAHTMRQTRVALDVAGHAVVVVNITGELLWRSAQAEKWLEEFFAWPQATLPPMMQRWLHSAMAQGGQVEPFEIATSAGRLVVRVGGSVNLGEQILLFNVERGVERPRRVAHPMLTTRETEVLYWLARGKTNRDIGDILEMSPRTVSKHLEHIYEKLGVETRAAATARALQDLLVHPP